MRILTCFLTMVALLFFTVDAEAAGLTPAAKGIAPEKAWNPWPEPDDIILPMPCNGQMVFRAVNIPAKGILYDRKMVMGVVNAPNNERDLYERRFEGHISAPFSLRDLPKEWQGVLQGTATADDFYYFIGKYEISAWQWRAVMEGSCPTAPTEADLRPKTDISWLEMQEFFYKYMDWLIKEHKNSLPVFADNDKDIGFLRLPTEEEWEFAARGGMSVPEETRSQEDFYPLKEYAPAKKSDPATDLKFGDFAIYQSGDRSSRDPSPIGTRKPGPLLTYDMAGNAKELVQSAFRFSVADYQGGATVRRLHGTAGGLVSKGGSFLSGEESILPGWRAEVPFFQESGKYAMRDLGFRAALSGINTPASSSRLQKLDAENKAIAEGAASGKSSATAVATTPAAPKDKDSAVKFDRNGNLVSELDKIISATASPTVRDNLNKYRTMVTDNISAADRKREESNLNSLRSTLFQAEMVVNTAYRIRKTERDFADAAKKGQLKESDRAQANNFLSELGQLLGNSINKYRQDVETLSQENPESFDRNFSILRQEYAANDHLGKRMRSNLSALQKHLAQVRSKGISTLSKNQVEVDIIPEALRKPLN